MHKFRIGINSCNGFVYFRLQIPVAKIGALDFIFQIL